MPDEIHPPAESHSHAPDSPVFQQAVRNELADILHSAEFHGSQRCQDFLSFVVEQALTRQPIKERTVGIAVFGRSPDYDTGKDGMVRIKASEVRKRLALYHAVTGKDSEVVIDLPVGTYAPVFSMRARSGSNPDIAAPTVLTPPPDPPKTNGDIPLLFALFVLAVVAAGILWMRTRPSPSVLDQFWGPVLANSAPVVIYAAYTPVYLPSPNADETKLKVRDFVELQSQYVGGGDLMAVSRISGMLAHSGHAYNTRMGNISFEELRDSSNVLIGFSSTRWQELIKDLRFSIENERRGEILDNGKPTGWYPAVTPDRSTDEDYAIVARYLNPQTHSIMILVTGSEQYGTEAAADLITAPDLLEEALRGAPPGWPQKNLQLVLRVKVIGNSPAAPKVIASHYW